MRRLSIAIAAILLGSTATPLTFRTVTGTVTSLQGVAVSSGTVTFKLRGVAPAEAGVGIIAPLTTTCAITTGALGTCLLASPAEYEVTISPAAGDAWTWPARVSLAESVAATTLEALYLATAAAPTLTATCVLEGDNVTGLGSGSAVAGQIPRADGAGSIAWGYYQWFTGTRPTCNATNRGLVWYVAGGAGVADTFALCMKSSGDTYSWVSLF